ncbi:MAG: tRNA1(Val) (adenine(37)-N6)-methyltransferase [Desulfovibrionaceae bacterium]
MEDRIKECREYFPRGLHQVDGGFNFSVDAILLSSFAGNRFHKRLVDVGSGCGAIAIAIAIAEKAGEIIAIEREDVLVHAAKKNVVMHGFEEKIHCIQHDVVEGLDCGSIDAVVCNPPYFSEGSGYTSPYVLRKKARTDSDMGIFLDFCKNILRDKGYFYCSFTVSRLHEFLLALEAHSFRVKRMCFIQGRSNKGAKIVLIEARKNVQHGSVIVLPTLILYEENSSRYSKAAVEFCSFLAYNAV